MTATEGLLSLQIPQIDTLGEEFGSSSWQKSFSYITKDPSSPKPWVFIDLRTVYRDKVSKSNDVWWTLGRSDRDGKDLVVHPVVVHVWHREVEAIHNHMLFRLEHSWVSVGHGRIQVEPPWQVEWKDCKAKNIKQNKIKKKRLETRHSLKELQAAATYTA